MADAILDADKIVTRLTHEELVLALDVLNEARAGATDRRRLRIQAVMDRLCDAEERHLREARRG